MIAATTDVEAEVNRSTVCAEAGGIKIAKKSTTRRKLVPVALHLSKILNYLT
jgi:hypothetical protein